jgi:hypothetical protein
MINPFSLLAALLLFFQSFFELVSCGALPPQQLHALDALFNSTDGQHWRWITPYNAVIGYPWNVSIADPNPCSDEFPSEPLTGTINVNVNVNVTVYWP